MPVNVGTPTITPFLGATALPNVYIGNTLLFGATDPMAIAGLFFRWAAVNETGRSNNDLVASWTKQSGVSTAEFTASGTARATWNTTGFDGRPCLNFDGSANTYVGSSRFLPIAADSANNDHTIYCYYMPTSFPTGRTIFRQGPDTDFQQPRLIVWSATEHQFNYRGFGLALASLPTSLNQKCLVIIRYVASTGLTNFQLRGYNTANAAWNITGLAIGNSIFRFGSQDASNGFIAAKVAHFSSYFGRHSDATVTSISDFILANY